MALRATKELLERHYTADEFEQMPEFDDRYELLAGKVVEKSMPGDEHGSIVRTIVTTTVLLDPKGDLGNRWTDNSFQLDPWWEPIPDFAFVVKANLVPLSKGSVKATPSLVIEVHSPSDLASQKKRDEAAAKIQKYITKGVQIIWAINPAQRTVEVYQPGQKTPIATLKPGDTLTAENVLPGFSLPVADLFK